MRYVHKYNFNEKKALIRVDFNVPLDDHFDVTDDTRIQGAIPTIRKVRDAGGAVVLLSHLGRPSRGYERRFSLQHLVPHLSRLLGTPVDFSPSCIGPDTQAKVARLRPGQVLLLENVRFQDGETTGDPSLARALAAWGDVYINDAFGTAHRAHTSTTLLAHHFQDRLAGCLMQRELSSADRVLKAAKKPLVAIVGGAKIADKIRPLAHLLDRLDYLLVGGGVANTFSKALGGQLGDSFLEHDQVQRAWQLAQQAQQQKVQLVLPQDLTVSPKIGEDNRKRIVARGEVPAGWAALDIGPQAQQQFAGIVRDAQTILWCGPLGLFEIPSFQQGTRTVAAAVAQATQRGAFSLIGGGDSAAAVRNLGYADQVSHLSTGGGALLAYISGATLPGIVALQ